MVATFQKDQKKTSSALTQNSDRKRDKSTANTQTRSDAVKIGKNLATTPQHQANKVNLPKQFTPYVAPHSRTPAPFMQMVHALVAPNDIYGGTNYTNRNNHNL